MNRRSFLEASIATGLVTVLPLLKVAKGEPFELLDFSCNSTAHLLPGQHLPQGPGNHYRSQTTSKGCCPDDNLRDPIYWTTHSVLYPDPPSGSRYELLHSFDSKILSSSGDLIAHLSSDPDFSMQCLALQHKRHPALRRVFHSCFLNTHPNGRAFSVFWDEVPPSKMVLNFQAKLILVPQLE